MMFFFLIYYITTFLLQFFTVGAMYASITIFLKQQIGALLTQSNTNSDTIVGRIIESGFIDAFFNFFYIAMIVMAIIVSLTTPVDRGIGYFKFLMSMFGVLLIGTMTGIIFFLI
jgi:hypothetical protein